MAETFTVMGKAIRMEAHEVGSAAKPAPAILLLHGSGGNVDWWSGRMRPVAIATGCSLFAPHYFDRTGIKRAEPEMFADGVHVPLWLETIAAALDAVRSRPGVDPERVALVGVSLGGFLSLALAAGLSSSKDPAARARIRCLVELSGGLVEPFRAEATQHFPPTLILHGTRDDVVPVTQAMRLKERLNELGVAHEMQLLEGEGHWFSHAGVPMLLTRLAGFLQKHLR